MVTCDTVVGGDTGKGFDGGAPYSWEACFLYHSQILMRCIGVPPLFDGQFLSHPLHILKMRCHQSELRMHGIRCRFPRHWIHMRDHWRRQWIRCECIQCGRMNTLSRMRCSDILHRRGRSGRHLRLVVHHSMLAQGIRQNVSSILFRWQCTPVR